MSIHIGNNNKISQSTFVSNSDNINQKEDKKNFFEKHPLLLTVTGGVFVSAIMLFSFWKNVIKFIEGIFK